MKILKDKQLIKRAIIFTLRFLPFALVGIYFTIIETLKTISQEQKDMLIEQLGNEQAVIVLSMIQPTFLVIFSSFLGYLISTKIGLMKSFKIEKRAVLATLLLGVIGGLIITSDAFTFARVIPQVAEYYNTPITPITFLYSVLYGGIVEEILLRLFFMSLMALIIKTIFFKKDDTYSSKIFIAANIIAALLFSAGHLPATVALFGTLTPLIVFRCFLLNGIGGLCFGYLYRKHGIEYAMCAHALFHIVSKSIFLIFL